MNLKHLIISFAHVVMVAVVLFQLAGCGSGSGSDYPDFSSNDISGVERIEAYHLEHFPVTSADESTDNRAIYVDFSDGITKYALSDDNNKDVYKMLFKVADVYPSIEYFELSNDQLTQYKGSGKMAYFTDGGFEDNDGKLKQGAPIDQAINAIVERDNVGVLVTDGELYNSELKEVSEDTWASKAFEKWLNKGHELVIVYTDFVEKNNGGAYDKHMYVMFFIPNNHTEMLDNYISELDEEGLEYDSMSFSTNTNNLYRRDYPNSQLPGSSQYLLYFGDPEKYYRSETSAMEYVDMTPAHFHCDEDGLVYYLRDLGNPNTGKPQSYPIFEKLYFSFTSLSNYNVKELKLVVHDVYEDFKSYKKNVLARENLPVLEKSIFDGKDSLNDANYLVFNGMSLVDDEEPYDTSKVTVKDTIDGFVSKLKNEFKFNPTSFETTEKGVQDFLYLDKNAGLISETYAEGEYEIILKLSDKLNENNAYLNNQRSNLFRIDIILDVVEPKPILKEALTWTRIDDGELDDALYRSLKNIMKKDDVRPQGVVYSYYVQLKPFNQ